MTPMNPKIRRMARFFRVVFLIGMIASPLMVSIIWTNADVDTYGWMDVPFAFSEVADNMVRAGDVPNPLPMDIRVLSFAVTMLPVGVGMLALFWLYRLFGHYAQGEIFTQDTVRLIRWLGWTLIASALVAPLHEALLSLVLSMHNSPGHHILALSLDSAQITTLVTGGVVLVVSWIMDEGRRLREADELTV